VDRGAFAAGLLCIAARADLGELGAEPVFDSVLADELTGALDTVNGERVLGLLERLHYEGTTVVVITHDVELSARIPRRIELGTAASSRTPELEQPSASRPGGHD
jgi:predicted ABC-type transport system involved in lysophospholipase L1 biosynthesis ATPase subunit